MEQIFQRLKQSKYGFSESEFDQYQISLGDSYYTCTQEQHQRVTILTFASGVFAHLQKLEYLGHLSFQV